MGKGFLTYSTAVIFLAVDNGYLYGFDIIDITGVPGGTVYPALRRLEEAGYLTSKWEKPSIAQAEPRSREIRLAEWDRLDRRSKRDLLRRSASAFWDALRLQPRRLEDDMSRLSKTPPERRITNH